MRAAIRVQKLSKRYELAQRRGRDYRTLGETLTRAATSVWRGCKQIGSRGRGNFRVQAVADQGSFWALNDVSFEVQPGEVVGIIGRNGAGKSTLLKILSRITEPTTGRAEVRGRMGSLLEVGTGFHPELTGRENIYLNGSVLGMSRAEITRKFDEIVAFSEVEQFLEMPVKRYSSGMYVRLAFAIAAHLEPEILVVDEVLAVGDATYQRRCIERMETLARSGGTVLFVSHNMDLIPRLCSKAVLLCGGRVAEVGPARLLVQTYIEQNASGGGGNLDGRHRTGDGRARFVRWWLEDSTGKKVAVHRSGEDLSLCVEIEAQHSVADAALAAVFRTLTGTRLITSWTREVGTRIDLRPGRQVYRCHFERVMVRPGNRLVLMLWMEAVGLVDAIEDAGVLEVVDGPLTVHWSTDSAQGAVLYDYTWQPVE